MVEALSSDAILAYAESQDDDRRREHGQPA
jgi:hypothetical protein